MGLQLFSLDLGSEVFLFIPNSNLFVLFLLCTGLRVSSMFDVQCHQKNKNANSEGHSGGFGVKVSNY